ncbi:AGR211Wp [Eremothecium gossypii ATCC 10895]|uniref:Nuclear protein localization protein 4 n=1 Tax=Eremothecium gossypii (strain ATCC 10895 / CBS 109.51 / FGSC 9923 / NRRL Y-1056) TaxID=284811 RepID=NPL4_EREGS|nr:AGR211Wp [Eremothecium gossypii ATCC 10895]Q74ZJ1.1 RecName: Full=Nuclear protein localization protein 4 [Eremothecium gossypii ATCC 10895]AAS54701.1 AGR211Wp [Eremothecium gossypii ATCC 10895]
MILRFRSKHGMQRVNCEGSEQFGTVLDRWVKLVHERAPREAMEVGVAERQIETRIAAEMAQKTVEQLGLKHGDMLSVSFKETGGSLAVAAAPERSSELAVDRELAREEGLIRRSHSRLCRHGDRGMCEYCSPLPPWDRGYQQEQNLKHISFHAHVKELNEHTNKKASGSTYIPPLSPPDFHVNKHCPAPHEPWPRGICSKCQPSAISLQQQEFRMVDHVEFQHSELVNEFINTWRSTGMQRFGYLYGRYARYDNTPLGIKAVVEAIWEPEQHDEQDGLTMDTVAVRVSVAAVDAIAADMGLMRLGMIFTDLTDSGSGDGSVFCKRHKDSFFLSSLEVITAARHQLHHRNACRFSDQGFYSSKFVTCVVSGNLQGEIDVAAYQVSTDAEALVDADIISGSTHPSMAYINEPSAERYVPEIFYMRRNEYGITIKENAKPAFPVDYLIVSLTHGFPVAADTPPTFQAHTGFPWANRQAMGQSQDYLELRRVLLPSIAAGDYTELHRRLSSFHLLLYLHSLQILDASEWRRLVTVATTPAPRGVEAVYDLISGPGWQTLVMILQEAA